MATRFILTSSSTTPDASPTLGGSKSFWDVNPATRKILWSSTPYRESSVSTTQIRFLSGETDLKRGVHQYVSYPIVGGGTLPSSMTVTMSIRGYEDGTSMNGYISGLLFVCSNNGSTIRTNHWTAVDDVELPLSASAASRAVTFTNSGGDITYSDGDRLVLEIGCQATYVSASDNDTYVIIGGPQSTYDTYGFLDFNDSDTQGIPWFEISEDLTLAEPGGYNRLMLLGAGS